MTEVLLKNYKRWATVARYDAQGLAKLRGVSVRQLQREFKHGFGRSPQDWLNEQRIAAARTLLAVGVSVKQTALTLGYKQSSHFCRHFKCYSQITPSEYAGGILLDVANG